MPFAPDFDGVEAMRSDFGGVEAMRSDFGGVEAMRSDFGGVEAMRSDFGGVEAMRSDFGGVEAMRSDFGGVEAMRSDFGGVEAMRSDFGGVEAMRSDFLATRVAHFGQVCSILIHRLAGGLASDSSTSMAGGLATLVADFGLRRTILTDRSAFRAGRLYGLLSIRLMGHLLFAGRLIFLRRDPARRVFPPAVRTTLMIVVLLSIPADETKLL
ncbi:MAG: hypothetical protein U1F76_21095 [Candidatus Competibacteraceae bacterium]